MYQFVVYTDGACSGNPGPGAWAALLKDCRDGYEWSIGGSELNTTNNRMELVAAIQAIEHLPAGCAIDLNTDSEYLQKGASKWMHSWYKDRLFDPKNTNPKKEIKNLDLWWKIYNLCKSRKVNWFWVKGHGGIRGNEIADELAQEELKKLLTQS